MEHVLKIKVIPKASKNEIVGYKEDVLRVRLVAVPEKGKANEALITFLAKSWHLPKSAFSILSGETSRNKTVRIEGMIPIHTKHEK